jgi:dicarboxylate/amino acid:cation (Na+ or H+) symporter, DAACS family
MGAAHSVPHTRILIGLIGGAVLGSTVNALVVKGFVPAEPVDWSVKYLARPSS